MHSPLSLGPGLVTQHHVRRSTPKLGSASGEAGKNL
jgi:hypothetical protein